MEHKPLIDKSKDTFTRKGSMRRSTKSTVAIKCDKNISKSSDTTDNDMKHRTASDNDSTAKELDNSNEGTAKSSRPSSFLEKYDEGVGKPKNLQFESTDDWYAYASASDLDDSDGALSKPYGYNAVNPVLECVNQVRMTIRIG